MKVILKTCVIILAAVCVITQSHPLHARHPHNKFKPQHIHTHTVCYTPQVETLLLQTSFAESIGRTRYNVCPKGSSREERDLSRYLKEMKTVGLTEYLKRRQRCKENNWHTTTDAEVNTLVDNNTEEEGEDLRHYFPLGTEIVFDGCRSKGADDANNTVSMCEICSYHIFLPQSYYPRIHRHITCHNNGDYSCLTGSGVCVMNYVDTPLFYDYKNVGFNRLAEWELREVRFTKSCSCQIIKNDSMQIFV